MKKSLALIGFMGSGKSTIGALLAKMTGMVFVDLDKVVVEADGRGVNEIFAAEGEEGWRRLETAALIETAATENIVLAAGGGVVLKSENLRLLAEDFVTVYLRTSEGILRKRLNSSSDRPLLNVADREARLKELFRKRKNIYTAAADLIIDTDGQTPRKVAEKILALLKEKGMA